MKNASPIINTSPAKYFNMMETISE